MTPRAPLAAAFVLCLLACCRSQFIVRKVRQRQAREEHSVRTRRMRLPCRMSDERTPLDLALETATHAVTR